MQSSTSLLLLQSGSSQYVCRDCRRQLRCALLHLQTVRKSAHKGRHYSIIYTLDHRQRTNVSPTRSTHGYIWEQEGSFAHRPKRAKSELFATETKEKGTLRHPSRQALGRTAPKLPYTLCAQKFHTSARFRGHTDHAASRSSITHEAVLLNASKPAPINSSIRSRLRDWQALHADEEAKFRPVEYEQDLEADTEVNALLRLNGTTSMSRNSNLTNVEDQDSDQSLSDFMHSAVTDFDSAPNDHRALKMGDLVELSGSNSERDLTLAVFVRRTGLVAQFFTVSGHWTHQPETSIQVALPGWVDPSLVVPLISFLPDVESVENWQDLMDEAALHDLSVPRRISSPLISRMRQFQTESREIYRRHSKSLNSAHDILAHETELRIGTLTSAAATLLGIPAKELPLTALWATRSALMHIAYGFNFDFRSHRLTGSMHILSKAHVRELGLVRSWFRAWQDDMALVARMTKVQQMRHKPSKGAQILNGFISAARKIILESRKSRSPTHQGCIGPTITRSPSNDEPGAIKVREVKCFTSEESKIISFIENWACLSLFRGITRLEALPPLLLQKLGLYDEYDYIRHTGYMFLQEIGVVLPYDNRLRFDPQLLLPEMQEFLPLQNSLSRAAELEHDNDFKDSMEHLRQDWGNLPVYCIDDATAKEIDDGISVEEAGFDTNGNKQYWVHIHIANPTAYFDKDHVVANLARHMGESIYLPERVYSMLPGWVTENHFSLSNGRPCLTFSAKLNSEGETVEHRITPGIVRNVITLNKNIVNNAIGDIAGDDADAVVFTVGGTPPADNLSHNSGVEMAAEHFTNLTLLHKLAEKRSEVRKRQGGLFFNRETPTVKVWQDTEGLGSTGDQPYHRGSRKTIGDPIIQVSTTGLRNWFTATFTASDVLVRELMLLACETGAKWCAERQIPFIYRGTVRRSHRQNPQTYLKEVLEPAARKNANGEWPLHLAKEYTTSIGSTMLSAKPLKHRILGMDHYGKVTSPLRRYADMIAHWQIEAALREEAKSGQSLVTTDRKADRKFLPFSANALQDLFTGLQPRESLILSAKSHGVEHWTTMALFRAIHFGEAELPLPKASTIPTHKPSPRIIRGRRRTLPLEQRYTTRLYVYAAPSAQQSKIVGISMELNIPLIMVRPDDLGLDLPRAGDIWETQIEFVDVYTRLVSVWPVKLLQRDAGITSETLK